MIVAIIFFYIMNIINFESESYRETLNNSSTIKNIK